MIALPCLNTQFRLIRTRVSRLTDAGPGPHISQANEGHSVWSPGFSRSDAVSLWISAAPLLFARRVSAVPLRVPQLIRHGVGENGFMQGSDTSTPICARTASSRASRTPTPSSWPSARRTCWRKSAPGTPRGNSSSRRPSRRSSSATGCSGIGGPRYPPRSVRSPLGFAQRGCGCAPVRRPYAAAFCANRASTALGRLTQRASNRSRHWRSERHNIREAE